MIGHIISVVGFAAITSVLAISAFGQTEYRLSCKAEIVKFRDADGNKITEKAFLQVKLPNPFAFWSTEGSVNFEIWGIENDGIARRSRVSLNRIEFKSNDAYDVQGFISSLSWTGQVADAVNTYNLQCTPQRQQ